MPKVLRVLNRFNIGGPTFNASLLSKYLPEEYDTLLIGGANEESEGDSTFIVTSLGLEPYILDDFQREISILKDYKAYKEVRKIIREFKPDIIHTHASKAGAIGRLAAIKENVPVIVHTFHGHVFHSYFGKLKTQFYKTVERYLAKKSNAIITISDIQFNEIVNQHKIVSKEKARVVNLGFDLTKFNKGKEIKNRKFREEWGIEPKDIVVSIIGRITQVKNHLMFVDAISLLPEDLISQCKFIVVGDGELKSELEKYVHEKHLTNQFIFTSWIKETDFVYSASDIVALTSNNEGTPVTLIEAQASRTPIVSTSVGGIKDIVLNKETALLSPAHDKIAFSKNLKLLIEDKNLRDQMGSKGWEFVKEKFSYKRLVNDIDLLYKELLQK